VAYVDSIRSYYDILVWLDDEKNKEPETQEPLPLTKAPAAL